MLPLNVPKFEYASQNKVKCKLLVFVFLPFYCFEFSYSKMLPSHQECELCRFVSKVIMFQEAFQFWKAIAFCYNKHIGPRVIGHVPHYIIDCNRHFVSCCQCLHFKPIQRSLVVEWCFEYSHIHELETKGRNETCPFIGCLDWWWRF